MLFDVQAALAEILGEASGRCDSRDCRDSEGAKSQKSRESQSQAEDNSTRAELMPPNAARSSREHPDYLADRFEELAGILEYDEHMPRGAAERAAFRIIHGGKA